MTSDTQSTHFPLIPGHRPIDKFERDLQTGQVVVTFISGGVGLSEPISGVFTSIPNVGAPYSGQSTIVELYSAPLQTGDSQQVNIVNGKPEIRSKRTFGSDHTLTIVIKYADGVFEHYTSKT